MEEEAVDKLSPVEGEDAAARLEGDVGVGYLDDARVGDGDPLNIAREVLRDVLHGPAQRWLDINNPASVALGQIPNRRMEGLVGFQLAAAAQLKLPAP